MSHARNRLLVRPRSSTEVKPTAKVHTKAVNAAGSLRFQPWGEARLHQERGVRHRQRQPRSAAYIGFRVCDKCSLSVRVVWI